MSETKTKCSCKVYFGEDNTGLSSLIIKKLSSFGLDVIQIKTLKDLVEEKDPVLNFVLSEAEFGINESKYFARRLQNKFETIFVLFFSDEFFNLLDGDKPAYIPLIDFYSNYSTFPVTAFTEEDLENVFCDFCVTLKEYFSAIQKIKDNSILAEKVADLIINISRNDSDDFVYLKQLYFFAKELNNERNRLVEEISKIEKSFSSFSGKINDIQKRNSKKAVKKYSFKKYEEPSDNELVNKIILKYGNIFSKLQDFITKVESNTNYKTDSDISQMCEDSKNLLDEVCSLAVLGTFSSGKTTFINSLLMSMHKLRTSAQHNSAVLLKIEKAKKNEYYEVIYRDSIEYEILKATEYNEVATVYEDEEKLIVAYVDNKDNIIVARNSFGNEIKLPVEYGKKIIVRAKDVIKKGTKLTEGNKRLHISENSDFILNCVSKDDVEKIIEEIKKHNLTDYYLESENGEGISEKFESKDCLEILIGLKTKFTTADAHLNASELYKGLRLNNSTKIVFHGNYHKKEDKVLLKTDAAWKYFCDSTEKPILIEKPECYIFAKEIHLYMKSDFLNNCNIVDTPGFGSVTENHDAISERYLREHKGIMLILIKIDIHADSEEFRKLIKTIIQIEKTGSAIEKEKIYFILNCFRNNLSDNNLKEKSKKIYAQLVKEGFNKNNIFACNMKRSLEDGEFLKTLYDFPSYEIFRKQLVNNIETEGPLHQLEQIQHDWNRFLNLKIAVMKNSIKTKEKAKKAKDALLQETLDKLKIVEEIKLRGFDTFEREIRNEFKDLISYIVCTDKKKSFKAEQEVFANNLEMICLNLHDDNMLTDYYNKVAIEIKVQVGEEFKEIPENEQINFVFPSQAVISKYNEVVNSNWGLFYHKKDEKIQSLINYIEKQIDASIQKYHMYYLKINKRLHEMKDSALIKLKKDKKAFESDEANKKAIEEEKALLSELCETQKEFKLIADEISVYNIDKEEL